MGGVASVVAVIAKVAPVIQAVAKIVTDGMNEGRKREDTMADVRSRLNDSELQEEQRKAALAWVFFFLQRGPSEDTGLTTLS